MLSPVTIHHDGIALEGQIAVPHISGRRPAVLVMSNAHGLGNQARERARRLAGSPATDMWRSRLTCTGAEPFSANRRT